MTYSCEIKKGLVTLCFDVEADSLKEALDESREVARDTLAIADEQQMIVIIREKRGKA